MLRTFLMAKIHRATVTRTDVDYDGSIGIPVRLMDLSGILPYEQVHVLDINNGNRFITYAIPNEKSNNICVNGAAARLVDIGDKIIILIYGSAEYNGDREDEIYWKSQKPVVIKVDDYNMPMSEEV